MSLKLVSLASGSKGNATLVLSDSVAILVDAGISYTRVEQELKIFGLTPSMLDGVVLTHEHDDHIRAIPKLAEVTKIYAHPLTARAVAAKQGYIKNVADVVDYEGGFEIGDIKVIPFRVPHDAAYPLGYSFECGYMRCSVATDIGVPTRGLLKNIRESGVVLLEANHDVNMLLNGRYPQNLKARILSNNGHLSNDAAALVAKHLAAESEVGTLVLGHISENNNTEKLAFDTVEEALKSANSDIELFVAHQGRRSEVFEL